MTPLPLPGRPQQGRRAACGGLLLALTLTLVGCAAQRSTPEVGIASWNGRLALNVQSEPPEAYSAGFDLRGSPESGELLLATPLGTTLATLQWSPGRAILIQGDRTTERPSLPALSAALGGTELPVAALFGWLQGQPVEVQGWTVDLSRHSEGRITARRATPLPTAELRLVFEP